MMASPSWAMALAFLAACIVLPGVLGRGDSPGRCAPYEGTLCGGTVTYDVYLPGLNEGDPGYEDMAIKENILQAYFDVAGARISSSSCKVYFVQFVCAFYYPPCTEVVPDHFISRPACESTCSEFYEKCSDILSAALVAQKMGFTILPVPELSETSGKCDVDVYGGDTAFVIAPAESTWVTKYPYEVGYEGELVFPDESAVYTLDGTEHEVDCFNFVNFTVSCEDSRVDTVCNENQFSQPYIQDFFDCVANKCDDPAHVQACNKQVCPAHMVSHDGNPSCEVGCWSHCPGNRNYSDSEYMIMFVFYVVPGLAAIPMNFYICVGFFVGRNKVHKKARPYLKVAGYCMLLWGLLHIIPSSSLYTDMVCNDGTGESKGAKGICTFQRGTVHLLQAAYYWMTAAIVDLYMSIVLEFPDRKRSSCAKVVMAFATVVPLIMMCWTYGKQVNDPESLLLAFDGQDGVEYPNRVWNESKDFFTCSPRLRYFSEEIVTVHIHFVLGACIMVPMLTHIITKLLGSAFKNNQDKNTSLSKKVTKVFKKSGSKKLVIMGTMVTFLLILQLIAIANIFPKMEEFAAKDEEYDSCTYGMAANYQGEACFDDKSCCDYTDPAKLGVSPNFLLLALGYFFPVSTISFVYAVVCVGDAGHKTVWKELLGMKTAKVTAGQSSVSSSY